MAVATEFTTNYHLGKPDFNSFGWHDDVNGNFDIIDSIVFAFTGVGNVRGLWENATAYVVNDRVVDGDDGSLWECEVSHTSASFPTTFEEDRTNNPTFWQALDTNFGAAEQWMTAANYPVNQFLFDAGRYGVTGASYTSSVSWDQDVVDGNLIELVDVSGVTVDPSTDNALVRFDGTNGAFQNSGVFVDDADNVSGVNDLSTDTLTITGLGTGIAVHDGGGVWSVIDYEEGTWTPDLFGSTTRGSFTYDIDQASYIRIGNLVHLAHRTSIDTEDVSPAGNTRLDGLPFSVFGTFMEGGIVTRLVSINNAAVPADFSQYVWRMSGTEAFLGVIGDDGSSTSDMTVDILQAGTEIRNSFTYITDS